VLQPFLTMVVFTIVFGRLIDVPSEGIAYPVFAYTALLPWTFFASGVARSGNSLIQDPNLLSKVYFPRIALPLAAISSVLLDFAVAFVILIGMMLVYDVSPGVEVVALPGFVVLAYLTAVGTGLWLSALNVKYRDFALGVPTLMLMGLFITPITYPLDLVKQTINEQFQFLYSLNPMVGVIEAFRWAVLGSALPDAQVMAVPFIAGAILLITGAFYFERAQRSFADLI
jgi:lipopolysaccharide transport system permease protein